MWKKINGLYLSISLFGALLNKVEYVEYVIDNMNKKCFSRPPSDGLFYPHQVLEKYLTPS